MRLSFTIISSFFIAIVSASNVLDLTPENFDKVVGQGKPALVELYVSFGVFFAFTECLLMLNVQLCSLVVCLLSLYFLSHFNDVAMISRAVVTARCVPLNSTLLQ